MPGIYHQVLRLVFNETSLLNDEILIICVKCVCVFHRDRFPVIGPILIFPSCLHKLLCCFISSTTFLRSFVSFFSFSVFNYFQFLVSNDSVFTSYFPSSSWPMFLRLPLHSILKTISPFVLFICLVELNLLTFITLTFLVLLSYPSNILLFFCFVNLVGYIVINLVVNIVIFLHFCW